MLMMRVLADDDFCAQGELLDQPAKRAWGDFHPLATPPTSPIWFQFKGEWGGRDGVSGDNPTHVLVTIWERPTCLQTPKLYLSIEWLEGAHCKLNCPVLLGSPLVSWAAWLNHWTLVQNTMLSSLTHSNLMEKDFSQWPGINGIKTRFDSRIELLNSSLAPATGTISQKFWQSSR